MNVYADPMPTPMPPFSLSDLQKFLSGAEAFLEILAKVLMTIPAAAPFAAILQVLMTILKLFINDPSKKTELLAAMNAFA